MIVKGQMKSDGGRHCSVAVQSGHVALRDGDCRRGYVGLDNAELRGRMGSALLAAALSARRIAPVAMSVLAYFWLADGPESAQRLSDKQKRVGRIDLDANEALKPKDAKTHGFVGALYLAAIGWFIVPWPGSVINLWAPSIIKQSGVNDVRRVSLSLAIPYLCGAVSMLFVCWNSDRAQERRRHFTLLGLVAAAGVSDSLAQPKAEKYDRTIAKYGRQGALRYQGVD
jgi:hypothetical protein